ncbi:hypothetical protein ATANTOWER_001890 [Ataeniobius toweri]|uniref:Uncharacterized protein n=1 Tax=Ataeniobius toweri TaxID=208326 RepID=A0ABU7CE01_9TELE|nr:hypothetical protein [Ataeniobius toweri]
MNTYTLWTASPEEVKLLLLQRVEQHHIEPYGLRMGCHLSSYANQGSVLSCRSLTEELCLHCYRMRKCGAV